MDSDSDMDNNNTPPELQELTTKSTLDLLPQKSRILYEKQYNTFKNWRQEHNVDNLTENVLLTYFSSRAGNNYRSSTLWSIYSMLKSTLAIKENVNISKFPKLITFLKTQSVGYKAKKSRVFSRDEINKFLRYAPDVTYLLHKLCLIIGIAGGCRRDELRKITTKDIVDQGDMLVITIPDLKNGKRRVFTVTDKLCDGVNPLEIFRQYANLRPRHSNHNTFFVNYKLGKCTVQVVGVHTFAKIPSLIARFLKLPNEQEYTGHCYRRTSATLLANTAADIVLSSKQQGGWKSSTVAEGYIEDSISNKINVSKNILTDVEKVKDEADMAQVQFENHTPGISRDSKMSLIAKEKKWINHITPTFVRRNPDKQDYDDLLTKKKMELLQLQIEQEKIKHEADMKIKEADLQLTVIEIEYYQLKLEELKKQLCNKYENK